jgi:adenylate cyclase
MDFALSSWLDLSSGQSVPIRGGPCSIGRSPSNQVVLGGEMVSRHHAVIQTTDDEECWIIDLASANGTYVNRRRVEHALRLRDGDEITIGTWRLTFRSPAAGNARSAGSPDLDQTAHDTRPLPAWLFLADIQDSTGIAQRLGPTTMAGTFAGWMADCRAILDVSGGIIDKPLGDGFFAFWSKAESAESEVARALRDFRDLRSRSALPFRMVLHLGTAFTGGQMASGTYRLFGPDVNFTFRMERLAKGLELFCLLSEPACQALARHVTPESAGWHPIPGLDGSFAFYRL